MMDESLRPAAFLDRDGTIIVERNYPSDPAQVELIPGAAAALRRLRDAGYALIVVTNQSGIARGLLDEAAFRAVQARVDALLESEGVTLDAIYFCPHHPDFTGPCDCRKPGLRLFREAAETHGVDLARSAYIGDRLQDVLPAFALGGVPVLVRTGYGQSSVATAPEGVRIAADLGDAAGIVLDRVSG